MGRCGTLLKAKTNPVRNTQPNRPRQALFSTADMLDSFGPKREVEAAPCCGICALVLGRNMACISEAFFSESFLACPGTSSSQRNKSLCFVLHLQVVELTRSPRCFTCEDINGKALVPGTGMVMNMGVSFMGLPPVDQKHSSGQTEAVVLTCSLCRLDLRYVGARLLPGQHLLWKHCFQGLIQELGPVAKAHGTVSDGK